MIITSSGEPGTLPAAAPGSITAAAVDVEWSKNYRVKNGNIPFCYSVIWLTAPTPASGSSASLAKASFRFLSAYVEEPAETHDLIGSADRSLRQVLDTADLIAGHQLCSDLAVLANTADGHLPAVADLRTAWRQRRMTAPSRPRVIDTRYDIGHLLGGASRRLVDVCADLHLDVTQPELRGTSMTALHRRWLESGDVSAREKISVLNLRHSLSTALVALHAAGIGHWDTWLNVNQILANGLGDNFTWTAAATFTGLLEDQP